MLLVLGLIKPTEGGFKWWNEKNSNKYESIIKK